MCLQKQKGCFFNNLYKSWELHVTLPLPSDCCVRFRTNESEKPDTILFVQTYQKRKAVPYMEMSSDNAQNTKESPYMEKSRDNDQKRCVYK